jgi:acetamidase/formamidase
MNPDRIAEALAAVPVLDTAPSTGPHLASTPDTVSWGWMPAAGDGAVLEVAPGDVVTVDTVSHEGILGDQGRDPVRFFGGFGVPADAVLSDAAAIARGDLPHDPCVDGPHVVTGPVAVAGARPGDVLSVTVLDLVPRVPYGIVSTRHGLGALPGEVIGDDPVYSAFCLVEDGAGSIALRGDDPGRRARFPLAPFLGFVGVAGRERIHSVAPGPHGGNIDVRLLGVGSTLHLPVAVPGGLLGVGDPHFAQGDGEVALTAFEAPLRATLRLDLVPADEVPERFGTLTGPLGETPDLWIPIGLDPDLDEAMRDAVRRSLDLLGHHYGMDRRQAYGYLSVATHYAVSQVVDGTKGVHGAIRKADFG